MPSCTKATSQCELHSGAIIEMHDLVSYQSLGVDRSWRLVYCSPADPRPIVHFSVNHTHIDPALHLVADMTVSRGTLELQVPGIRAVNSVCLAASTFGSCPPRPASLAARCRSICEISPAVNTTSR